MAKGVGLIGNFKGKVGNTVGYSLKDSNNKQTQGIRVYQPVVRNPKTYAQAEQRMKLAPINATYRALKMIIDRGQEGLAYGNKSRLAWLSEAIKAFAGGYFEKSAAITAPALVPLTKGSIALSVMTSPVESSTHLTIDSAMELQNPTMGELSAAILVDYPSLKDGDQLTFINVGVKGNVQVVQVESFVIDTTSTEPISNKWLWEAPDLTLNPNGATLYAGAIIASREGENGAHLRSTTNLRKFSMYPAEILTDDAKEAAIVSYMSQGANTDWAEESLMQ